MIIVEMSQKTLMLEVDCLDVMNPADPILAAQLAGARATLVWVLKGGQPPSVQLALSQGLPER